MKNWRLIFLFGTVGLMLQSCYSPSLMVDDDVYVMKSSVLGVGESTSDEASYASYRQQRDNRAVSSHFYNDDVFFHRNRHRFFLMNAGFGFQNPYFRPGMGMYYGFGSPFYSPFMFGAYDPFWGYDPFFMNSPYGFNSFGNPWSMGGYGMYGGYGWNTFGMVGNNSSWNNTTTNYNHHSGPRGSFSGIGNPSGRSTGTQVIKSIQSPNQSNPNLANGQLVQQKRIDRSVNVGQTVRDNTTNTIKLPNSVQAVRQVNLTPSSDRGIRPSGAGSSPAAGRTLTNSQNSPNRNSNTNIRMENPGPSRGASGSGGGISGGSSGRSGGAPASGGARRN